MDTPTPIIKVVKPKARLVLKPPSVLRKGVRAFLFFASPYNIFLFLPGASSQDIEAVDVETTRMAWHLALIYTKPVTLSILPCTPPPGARELIAPLLELRRVASKLERVARRLDELWDRKKQRSPMSQRFLDSEREKLVKELRELEPVLGENVVDCLEEAVRIHFLALAIDDIGVGLHVLNKLDQLELGMEEG